MKLIWKIVLAYFAMGVIMTILLTLNGTIFDHKELAPFFIVFTVVAWPLWIYFLLFS